MIGCIGGYASRVGATMIVPSVNVGQGLRPGVSTLSMHSSSEVLRLELHLRPEVPSKLLSHVYIYLLQLAGYTYGERLIFRQRVPSVRIRETHCLSTQPTSQGGQPHSQDYQAQRQNVVYYSAFCLEYCKLALLSMLARLEDSD